MTTPFYARLFGPAAAAPLAWRPAWPGALGAIGGASICAGSVVSLAQPGGEPAVRMLMLSLAFLAAGGAALGAAWLGLRRYGEGGTGPIVGSFALAGGASSLLVAIVLGADRLVELGLCELLIGLLVFVLGHVFTRGMRPARGVALGTLLVLAWVMRNAALADVAHPAFSVAVWLGIATMGTVIAAGMVTGRPRETD